MSNIPKDLKYTESHEWVQKVDDDEYLVGITDHAQELLGDIVYVELPHVGDTVNQGEESGVIESVKAASDIYAPISGDIIEVNTDLAESPETINADPYQDGWLYKVRTSDDSDYERLLSAEEYQQQIDNE